MKFKNQLKVFTYLSEHYEKHNAFICNAIDRIVDDENLHTTCMKTMEKLRPKNGKFGTNIHHNLLSWWSTNVYDAEVIGQKKAFLRHVVNHLSKKKATVVKKDV